MEVGSSGGGGTGAQLLKSLLRDLYLAEKRPERGGRRQKDGGKDSIRGTSGAAPAVSSPGWRSHSGGICKERVVKGGGAHQRGGGTGASPGEGIGGGCSSTSPLTPHLASSAVGLPASSALSTATSSATKRHCSSAPRVRASARRTRSAADARETSSSRCSSAA